MTDLREKVARAIFDHLGPDNAYDYPSDLHLSPYADAAEAAIAIARPAIIEECAKVAEECAVSRESIGFYYCANRIRKLAEKA